MVVGDGGFIWNPTTLKGILEKMKTTSIRFGTTGTLDGSECHRLQLEGSSVKKVISSTTHGCRNYCKY